MCFSNFPYLLKQYAMSFGWTADRGHKLFWVHSCIANICSLFYFTVSSLYTTLLQQEAVMFKWTLYIFFSDICELLKAGIQRIWV